MTVRDHWSFRLRFLTLNLSIAKLTPKHFPCAMHDDILHEKMREKDSDRKR